MVFIADICARFKECNTFLKQDYLSGETCLNILLANENCPRVLICRINGCYILQSVPHFACSLSLVLVFTSTSTVFLVLDFGLRQLRKIWLFRIPSFCAESSSKQRFTFQQLVSSEALNWHVKGKTSDFFFAHSIVITVFTFTNFAQIWFDFWSFRKTTSGKALSWHVGGEKRSISSACLLRHDVIRLANENFRPFPTKLSNMLKNLNFIFKKCSFYC